MSEFEILQKIILPTFLLHHEDYQLIQMPPVKNFVIMEKEKTAQQLREALTLEREGDQEYQDDAGYNTGSQKKNFIIVTVIVFLAAIFAVGIYFAVDLSNQ